jgi:hypothetical protein
MCVGSSMLTIDSTIGALSRIYVSLHLSMHHSHSSSIIHHPSFIHHPSSIIHPFIHHPSLHSSSIHPTTRALSPPQNSHIHPTEAPTPSLPHNNPCPILLAMQSPQRHLNAPDPALPLPILPYPGISYRPSYAAVVPSIRPYRLDSS